MKPAWRNILVVVASVAFAVALTLALDHVAGLYLYATHRNAGLIWGPYSNVRHSTPEFSYTARINNLGFRDRDFSVRKRTRWRVLALGDSYTYGWGVAIGETWPKQIERRLRAAGFDVEVADLGSPGAGPKDYADLAEKAVPLLGPDLVIVAMVQADDLLQCAEDAQPPRDRLRRRLLALYPNLMQLAGSLKPARVDVSADQLKQIWKQQAGSFLKGLSDAEQLKYAALPAEVRGAYIEGNLNPGLLFYSMRHPAFLVDACDLGAPATKHETAVMSAQLERIRSAAGRHGASVLVAPVPYPAFSSQADLEAMRSLGFAAGDDFLSSGRPDETIRHASEAAGLAFVSVTDAFRREAARRSLFFHWDGHLNAAGHDAYAALLAPEVSRRLRAQ